MFACSHVIAPVLQLPLRLRPCPLPPPPPPPVGLVYSRINRANWTWQATVFQRQPCHGCWELPPPIQPRARANSSSARCLLLRRTLAGPRPQLQSHLPSNLHMHGWASRSINTTSWSCASATPSSCLTGDSGSRRRHCGRATGAPWLPPPLTHPKPAAPQAGTPGERVGVERRQAPLHAQARQTTPACQLKPSFQPDWCCGYGCCSCCCARSGPNGAGTARAEWRYAPRGRCGGAGT